MRRHIESLSFPMDSWLEDRLLESVICGFMYQGQFIGYTGLINDTLHFFHVKKEFFKYAPAIFERVLSEKAVKSVFVMTQDPLLSALMAEWDYEKEMQSCCFTDSGRIGYADNRLGHAVFRSATENDTNRIRLISGDFFDEVSGGLACLEDRIAAETIFVLEDEGSLLGCGIIEKGQFSTDCVSIGMYTARSHRKKGVAGSILSHLKEWAYGNNLRPVAGCWYYNTLSRKTLQSAGMIATSIGYSAVLKGKEKLPLRTGNPPGELVEENGE